MQDSQNQKFRLRVTFSKEQSLSMLSHLEVARALEATVRRSGLKYMVSQGYSPHMKISFGRALSVGVSSENEIFDVFLSKYISAQQALLALQKVQCAGLKILNAEYVENKSKAASLCYSSSKYRVEILGKWDIAPVPDIVTVKKAKKTKEIEVSKFLMEKPQIVFDDGKTIINFQMRIIDGASIKPEVFVYSILKSAGQNHIQITSISKHNLFDF